jgi:hypothetical protein
MATCCHACAEFSEIRRGSKHEVQEERRMRANPIFKEIGPHELKRKSSLGCFH